MMSNYPWFDVVNPNENLMQGDFILDCPIIIPPLEITDENDVDIVNYDVIVMSQSCDIENKKIDIVIVCPIWDIIIFGNHSPFFQSDKGKEELRRGNTPGYHLLNICELNGFNRDYTVVDFRNIYSVPLDFLCNIAESNGQRLRLLPPYREHLSHAFARFFMRVGLPLDIPPFR